MCRSWNIHRLWGERRAVESLHFSLAFLKMHKSQVGSYTNKTKNREQRTKNEAHKSQVKRI